MGGLWVLYGLGSICGGRFIGFLSWVFELYSISIKFVGMVVFCLFILIGGFLISKLFYLFGGFVGLMGYGLL